MDLNRDYKFDVETRLKAVTWFVAVFFVVVTLRLFYLQVIRNEHYKFFSENNSIRQIDIPPVRGVILDRNGEVAVDNRPAFDIVIIPQYVKDKDVTIASLSKVLGLSEAELRPLVFKTMGEAPFRAVPILTDVDFDYVSKIKAHKMPFADVVPYNLDGVEVVYRYARTYPDGESASHLLGYVREIDREQLKNYNEIYSARYRKGDYVGVNGIEEKWDVVLRGSPGGRQIVVDALGREISGENVAMDLIDEGPVNGATVDLTIDLKLQKRARELLGDKKGSVVALDPSTGAVLALYSSPSYDLNKLTSKERNAYWAEINFDENRPLFNRATQGLYPPASTYKIVTAAGVLEEELVSKEEKINCTGGMNFGNRFFGCWLKSGHGSLNIVDAIVHSCDVFFYKMGLRLGVDKLAEYARLFGLGKKTGIDIPGEKGGLIPTSIWKLDRLKDKWHEGETLSIAIGQGYNLVTPLQAALMGSVVANGGYRVGPYLVEKVVKSNGEKIYERKDVPRKIEEISDDTIATVKEGLINVVASPGGTAHRLNQLGLKIAGKTGTAQVVSKDKESGKKYFSHAWFVGFAPYDNPKIAVAVIVEHGGHGSSAAAPVAGEIISEYLGNQ